MKNRITLVNVVSEGALYNNTRMPALSLAYLAAYVPKNWDVRIVDETVEPFNAFKHIDGSDIVGISGGNVCNIERIIKHLEAIQEHDSVADTNTPVVLGGYVGGLDVAGLPNRVDAIVSGPGELALQELLHDFERGKLKGKYAGKRLPLNLLKSPDFSSFNLEGYGKNINWPVQTSVSCDNKCTFCSARFVYGDGYAARDPELVLKDIRALPNGDRMYFTDPNIVHFSEHGMQRAKELFSGMSKMRKKHTWFGSVGFQIREHDDLLSLIRDSGCYGLLIGFDSMSPKSLAAVSSAKSQSLEGKDIMAYHVEGVKKIQEQYGIKVLGTFVVGFDSDTDETLNNTIRFVKESGMNDAQYLPFTPLPGTPAFDDMKRAGRIFDDDFSHYDFTDVVFVPNNFSPRELRRGFVKMYDETVPRMLKIYRRLGLIRDRPDEIRVQSMRQRAIEADRQAANRGGGGGHH